MWIHFPGESGGHIGSRKGQCSLSQQLRTTTQVGLVDLTTTVVHALELQEIDTHVSPWEEAPIPGMASATDLGWAASNDWRQEPLRQAVGVAAPGGR